MFIRQRVEDFQLGIESYQTQLNLTKPWAVTFGDKYGIDEALDYRVKEFRVNSDKSKDEYKILDEERRCRKQGVHVRYPKTAKDTTYLLESGELCWWTDSRRRLLVTE
ncbi:hypothetical protein Tco_0441031, partial [Tanacetum coccineum]